MTALGKILHEIDLHAIEFEVFGVCDDYVSVEWVKDIVKKHLSENKCSECSRRKYRIGYEDGKKNNDGWTAVEDGLPKTNGVYNVTRLIEGRYISDSVYFDGQNTWHNDNRANHSRDYLKDVVYWSPLPEKYQSKDGEL